MQALHAKVAAMLLHPRRRSWKLLMRRAFERYLPALGPAVLVSSLAAANAPGRSRRHVGYWRAFSQLRPHRLLDPACMSLHQHMQERLASNCRITKRGTGDAIVELLDVQKREGQCIASGRRRWDNRAQQCSCLMWVNRGGYVSDN